MIEPGPRRKQVDDPARDPHVRAIGFDVCSLTPAEMADVGIKLRPLNVHADPAAGVWISHSEYAGLDPARDHMDRSYARAAMHRHADRLAIEREECPVCRAAAGKRCLLRPGVVGAVHKARLTAMLRAAGGLDLRGLKLQRTFPCVGFFRTLEWVGPLRVVQCDACGDMLGVRPPEEVPEPEDASDVLARAPKTDEIPL